MDGVGVGRSTFLPITPMQAIDGVAMVGTEETRRESVWEL